MPGEYIYKCTNTHAFSLSANTSHFITVSASGVPAEGQSEGEPGQEVGRSQPITPITVQKTMPLSRIEGGAHKRSECAGDACRRKPCGCPCYSNQNPPIPKSPQSPVQTTSITVHHFKSSQS